MGAVRWPDAEVDVRRGAAIDEAAMLDSNAADDTSTTCPALPARAKSALGTLRHFSAAWTVSRELIRLGRNGREDA